MRKLWGRKISDLAFYEFLNILKAKSIENGKIVYQIDKWFPSTQLCNCCNYKNIKLSLKDISWDCPACGENHDRDRNAALNILTEGSSSVWRDYKTDVKLASLIETRLPVLKLVSMS